MPNDTPSWCRCVDHPREETLRIGEFTIRAVIHECLTADSWILEEPEPLHYSAQRVSPLSNLFGGQEPDHA